MPDIEVIYNGEGEWIYPEGGSTNLNDYDVVITNGILGKRKDFVDLVNRNGTPGYFNPSEGFFGDIAESAAQKFGGASDPLAAGFAREFAGVDHPMTIIAHSQGTLTVANAEQYFGLPRGSTFEFRSPAIGYSSAAAVAAHNGGSLQYIQRWGDAANLWGPSLNPLKWISGMADFFCGFCIHGGNGLGGR